MMKKVLIFLTSLNSSNGVANCLMQYYDDVVNNGMHIDYLVINDEESAWKEKIKKHGNVYVWPKGKRYSRNTISYLRSIICENEYSIVHVNVPGKYGATLLRVAKKCNVPVRIYHTHNPKAPHFSKSWVVSVLFDSRCCKLSNALLACSTAAGRSSFGKKEFHVLRNCIDAEAFGFNSYFRDLRREELGISQESIVIGCVGRLEKQKNPMFALKCIKELRKIRDDFVFIWLGKGSLHDKMWRFIRKNRMEDYVILPGVRSNINEWYSAMDCFFLPSQFEGLGIVYIEAQAAGIRCIGSTNVPEDTEITPLMERVDLKKKPRAWAAILSQSLKKCSTDDRFVNISDTGYDIRYESQKLFQIYSDTLK